ncbi:hypothetical protein ATO4_15810 [Aurantimonas sp. 22II-16-19i]|nr:hypothetical protein ATO4_15810 [Aurantimonas sp. 22II-16-19i]
MPSQGKPILRRGVDHLLEAESIVRLTRKRIIGTVSVPIKAEEAAASIEAAIAVLVHARVEIVAGNLQREEVVS